MWLTKRVVTLCVCCFFVERAAGGDDVDAVSASGAERAPDDDYDQSGAAADAGLLFRCRICWKGFKHPMSLTLHKDLHTGQTRCPICQRIFSRSYDMKAHLLRIHKYHTFSVDAKSDFRKWWWPPRPLFLLFPFRSRASFRTAGLPQRFSLATVFLSDRLSHGGIYPIADIEGYSVGEISLIAFGAEVQKLFARGLNTWLNDLGI